MLAYSLSRKEKAPALGRDLASKEQPKSDIGRYLTPSSANTHPHRYIHTGTRINTCFKYVCIETKDITTFMNEGHKRAFEQ